MSANPTRAERTSPKAAIFAILLGLILILGLLGSLECDHIRDGASLEASLSRPGEAYLFVTTIHRGYKDTYLTYAADWVKSLFYYVSEPQNERRDTIVLHVGIQPTEVRTFRSIFFNRYTPMGDGIYAQTRDSVSRWTGSAFVPATAEEKTGLVQAWRSGEDYWHVQRQLPNGLSLNLNGHQVSITVRSFSDKFSVQMESEGGRTETLLEVEQGVRKVTPDQYESAFDAAAIEAQ